MRICRLDGPKNAKKAFADIRKGLWLMIYEVEVSEQADSDLRGIFEYISFELQSPENASGQLDRLEEQILKSGYDAGALSKI